MTQATYFSLLKATHENFLEFDRWLFLSIVYKTISDASFYRSAGD